MLFSANLRKGVGGQIGKRNNKPNFVALGRATKSCQIKSPDERNKIKILLRSM